MNVESGLQTDYPLITKKHLMTHIKPGGRITLATRIGRTAINDVVDDFYNQIQSHSSLSQPFSIVGHWPEHKQKISEFWWMVLGGKSTVSYRYDPVTKHFSAGFTAELLDEWKTLFHQVLNQHLNAELATAWFERVEIIGANLVLQNNRLTDITFAGRYL